MEEAFSKGAAVGEAITASTATTTTFTSSSSLLVVTELAELDEANGTRSYESAVLIGQMGAAASDSMLLSPERWKVLEGKGEQKNLSSVVDLSTLPFRLAEVQERKIHCNGSGGSMEWRQVLWQDNDESSSHKKKEVTMVAKDNAAWSLFGDDESDSDE